MLKLYTFANIQTNLPYFLIAKDLGKDKKNPDSNGHLFMFCRNSEVASKEGEIVEEVKTSHTASYEIIQDYITKGTLIPVLPYFAIHLIKTNVLNKEKRQNQLNLLKAHFPKLKCE